MAKGKPDETVRLSCKLPEHELELLRKSLLSEVYQRDVICKWRTEVNEKGGREWVLRRTDTHEAVSVAPLRADENQEEMFS
jgi:hypothetical protein